MEFSKANHVVFQVLKPDNTVGIVHNGREVEGGYGTDKVRKLKDRTWGGHSPYSPGFREDGKAFAFQVNSRKIVINDFLYESPYPITALRWEGQDLVGVGIRDLEVKILRLSLPATPDPAASYPGD